MPKYREEVAGRGGWSRWIKPVKRGYKMACCDCGLVHDMDFKYERLGGRGVFIFFRVKRNVRATAGMKERKAFRKLTPSP